MYSRQASVWVPLVLGNCYGTIFWTPSFLVSSNPNKISLSLFLSPLILHSTSPENIFTETPHEPVHSTVYTFIVNPYSYIICRWYILQHRMKAMYSIRNDSSFAYEQWRNTSQRALMRNVLVRWLVLYLAYKTPMSWPLNYEDFPPRETASVSSRHGRNVK